MMQRHNIVAENQVEKERMSFSGKLPILPESEEQKQDSSKKYAFVIITIIDEFRDTYSLGIRETLQSHGYICRRINDVEFNGKIMEQILDLINSSQLIVAEVSEPNPNVYYELGISHTLGKDVVLCTQDVTNIPFDTREMNHIEYSDIVDLRGKLSIRVESL